MPLFKSKKPESNKKPAHVPGLHFSKPRHEKRGIQFDLPKEA